MDLPDGGRIGHLLRQVADLSQDFERHLGATLTVNPTDLAAMRHLIDDGPTTPGALADRLGISTAAATLVVDRLEAVGHARRTRDALDRRRVIVVPEPASVGRAARALLPVIQGVADTVGTLSATDRAVVEAFLERVVDVYRAALDDAAEPGVPERGPAGRAPEGTGPAATPR